MDGTVLVADDDRTIRTVLTQALTRAGCKVHATSSLTTLMRWVAEGKGDVVITDVVMPDGNGLEMLPKIAQDRPDLPVIVISAQNTIMTAIQAAEAEAFDYLPKPFDLDELCQAVRDGLRRRGISPVQPNLTEADAALPLIGRSAAMQEVYRTIARVVPNDLTVLILGESGTGKELVAQAIHDLGLAEVARIRGEFETVRKQLGWTGDLKSLFEHVRTDPKFYCKTQDELIARFAEIESCIWPAMPRLFHRRPSAPFKVAPLPALGGQRGTGYYRAGPPDGVSPGILFFNMAMLDTRPIPTLETLTLHEGIPGHHYQVTLVNEDKTLPDTLKRGGSTAYSEGWGLYAESLGRELGMFADPWAWFGHLDMEMLRAVRLVVDTGLHEFGWNRDRAIAYMLDNTSMAPRDGYCSRSPWRVSQPITLPSRPFTRSGGSL